MSINIDYPVKLFPQPTNMSCWSAAATMVIGNQCVGPGKAKLGKSGGLKSGWRNIEDFAESHGFTMHFGQTWTVRGMADLLRKHGPLWIAGKYPNGHALVLGGLKGDGTAEGTRMTIYDPWPPNKGAIHRISYFDYYNKFPEATDYILHL